MESYEVTVNSQSLSLFLLNSQPSNRLECLARPAVASALSDNWRVLPA